MATILDGLQRGSNRSRSYFDRQTSRRLAAEQGAREQSEFEQTERAQDYTNVFVRLRDQGLVTVDTSAENPRLRLSKDFNTRLAAGDAIAQQAAIDISNRGLQGKVPEGFKIDRIDTVKDEDGNSTYVVGGVNADGSRGVLTEQGTSDDNALAKQFGGDELFKQVQFAFQDRNGVLYGQRAVDLNSLANSRDLIIANAQGELFAGLQNNPAAQRQAAATIATSETPEEEAELTNQLRQDVGLPPVAIPTESEPEPEETPTPAAKPAPTDNSVQVTKTERATKEFKASIREQVKKAGGSANTQALEFKRLMNEAGYDTFGRPLAPEKSKDSNARRTRGERKFASLPPIVEEQIAPAVDGKTFDEIDEAIDNGEVRVDQETAAAAAKDLQEQGVETAADLAKLDPRRQAFAYAMIIASTPNDGNRRAVRDQLINILETGVSDRGAEARQQDRLVLDQQKFIRTLRKDRDDLRKLNVPAIQGFMDELLDFNFDEDGRLTGDRKAFFNTASRLIPSIQAQTLLAENDPETASLLQRTGNQALSLVLQNMAASGDYGGAVDSFVSVFRPDVNDNINADLTGIDSDGELIFYGVRDGTDKDGKPTYRRQGEGVAITELRKINPDVANLLVKIAEDNKKARGGSG